MGKLKDLTGQRFGRLAVISRAKNEKNKVRWLCKCDCGKTHIAVADKLLRGKTKSCGCYRNEVNRKKRNCHHYKNLTGQRFGRLIPLEILEVNKAGYAVWLCKCDCGKTHIAVSSDILKGHVKSCGCSLIDSRIKNITEKNIFGHYEGTSISLLKSSKPPKNNQSGVKGVSWNKKSSK